MGSVEPLRDIIEFSTRRSERYWGYRSLASAGAVSEKWQRPSRRSRGVAGACVPPCGRSRTCGAARNRATVASTEARPLGGNTAPAPTRRRSRPVERPAWRNAANIICPRVSGMPVRTTDIGEMLVRMIALGLAVVSPRLSALRRWRRRRAPEAARSSQARRDSRHPGLLALPRDRPHRPEHAPASAGVPHSREALSDRVARRGTGRGHHLRPSGHARVHVREQ